MSLLKLTRNPSRAGAWKRHSGVAFFTGGVLAVAALVPPAWLPLPECRFLYLTGHPCPFCGFTRAFHAMANGEWAAALYDCPLGAVAFFFWGGAFLWHAVPLVSGWEIVLARRPRKGTWLAIGAVAAALILANWIYRLASGLH